VSRRANARRYTNLFRICADTKSIVATVTTIMKMISPAAP
jgi:hypothetical protein